MANDVDKREGATAVTARGEATTDRVTMAEAARLKGVSYHTVSRAVRRGKLPVLRLGRMALISMADLHAWQPMKERAPRKYRRKQRAGEAIDPLHLIDIEHLELVQQVATFYELIGTIATEGSLEELAVFVTSRFAEALHLDRAAMWQFDMDAEVARRLGVHNEAVLRLSDEVPIDTAHIIADFEKHPGPHIIEDVNALIAATGDGTPRDISEGPIIVAPMIYQNRQIGVLIGDWRGRPAIVSEEAIQLADMIATQVAIAVDNMTRREQETRRRLQLESILDDLNGAVSVFDHRGHMTYYNEAELEMFDLRPDEVWIGQHMLDFVSRKRRLSLTGQPISVDDNPMMRALRGERLQDLRQIVVRKNGEHRYVSTSSRPVFVNGELVGAVSVTRDITQTREAAQDHDPRYLQQLEHALRRSQAIADIVVEINDTRSSLDVDRMTQFAIDRIVEEFSADCGLLWIIGEDGRLQLSAAQNVDPGDLAETSFAPEDLDLANGALTRNKPVLVDVNAFQGPETMMRARTDITHVLIIPMRIRGQRTGVAYLGFQGMPSVDESDEIFASVWGRQCAQAIDTALLFRQIESAHGRLMGVIDQLPQAVVIVDATTGTVTVANRAASRLWGKPVEEGADARSFPVLSNEGERLEGSQHPLLRSVRTRQQVVSEPLLIPQPDGSQIEVLANHAPIMDLRGMVVGAVSVLQNRSDFKSLDRAKDEFISVVAHELRNPLTSLRGNLQLLNRRLRKREGEEADAERQRVDTAIQQVDRVADLVSRMLDVSRVDMGSLDVSPGDTDAVSLLKEVVNAAIGLEPTREFRVISPEAMPVVWDAARIHQVLSNLMQNAARYAPGTLVEITLEGRPNDRVQIRVRDHGPGVPEAIRRRLFKQYYRFDDGQEDEHTVAVDGSRGLGIGLYISARLVKQHYGSLQVHNHPEGGAVFTLDLPRDASMPASE